MDDFIDFKLNFFDNGDDKCCLEFFLNDGKTINIVCPMCVPTMKESHVMIAGSGHPVYLKEVTIK